MGSGRPPLQEGMLALVDAGQLSHSLAPRSTTVHASLSAHPEKWIMRSSPIITSSITLHRPRRTLEGSSKVDVISPPAWGHGVAVGGEWMC